MKELIKFENVSKTFFIDDRPIKALQGIDLAITEGEFLSIIGPSGSGKSTILHLMGLLDSADKGTIKWQGKNVNQLSDKEKSLLRLQKIGFIFQNFSLLEDLTVEENISLPLLIKSGLNYLSSSDHDTVEQLLKQLGLSKRAHHKPNQISGGQRQRVAIARALVKDPTIILADEPTGNLDHKTGEDIINILINLCKEKHITLIIATHDQKLSSKSDRLLVINEGKLTPKVSADKYID